MSRKNGGSRGKKKWREKKYKDMDDDEVRARLAMPAVVEYYRGVRKPKRVTPLTSA